MNLSKNIKIPKGKKAIRGFPLIYTERKKRYDLMLTPSAYQVLREIAQEQNLSISEALERHLRKLKGLPLPIHID
jgi:predicted transcriptional regulator